MVSVAKQFVAQPIQPSVSSSIIEEVEGLRNTGLAMMAYFYCDFRNPQKAGHQ